MQHRSRSKKIMVIDDIFGGQFLYSVLIDRLGYKTAFYDDPLLALQDVKSVKPRLIVSDICLPCIDGYAVLRAVRCVFPEVPFIMVSATPEYLEAASLIRNCRTLAKPFENTTFLNVIQESIAESHFEPDCESAHSNRVVRLSELKDVASHRIRNRGREHEGQHQLGSTN